MKQRPLGWGRPVEPLDMWCVSNSCDIQRRDSSEATFLVVSIHT